MQVRFRVSLELAANNRYELCFNNPPAKKKEKTRCLVFHHKQSAFVTPFVLASHFPALSLGPA